VDNKDKGGSVSSKKREANRRNAQLSTGPKTDAGKNYSRRNALKHGVLASALLVIEGEGVENAAEFEELLGALHQDLAPAGRLEEMMVEKLAVCWWRQKRALRCEAGLVRRAFVPDPSRQLKESMSRGVGLGPNPELAAIKDHLSLPLGADLDRILRYETTVQRPTGLRHQSAGAFATGAQRGARAGAVEHPPLRRSVRFLGQRHRQRCTLQCGRSRDGLAPLRLDLRSQFFMVRMVPSPSNSSSLVTSVRSMT
jgi:hypothetical protein